jgi:hypothetical protein
VLLTAAGTNEIGPSNLSNQTIQFNLFRAGASGSCSFHVQPLPCPQVIVQKQLCSSCLQHLLISHGMDHTTRIIEGQSYVSAG